MNKAESVKNQSKELVIESPGVSPVSARGWAVDQLTRVAEQFPQVEPPVQDLAGLSPSDAALALAIYRTTVQRWFTLRAVVQPLVSKQVQLLDPAMQAVLLSGAAQLVFFDRLPAYAVVDEAVELTRQRVRANASGMANAVLRKVARLVSGAKRIEQWSPDPCLIPLPGGGALRLPKPVLPQASPLDKHLVAATSMPLRLVREWLSRWGETQAAKLCVHGIENPPTTISVEPGFDLTASGFADDCQPHEHAGFVVWRGEHQAIGKFLAGHPDRRVQDVASSLAVSATAGHQPKRILDYCAGMGTKTRQLAQIHPQAQIDATDTHPGRRDTLAQAVAGMEQVQVVDPAQVQSGPAGVYDLVLLDVPCSNTGVLARRPEARYRFTQQAMGELVSLQREILEQALGWIKPGGLLLYSTCSIEPPENKKQVQRLLRHQGELIAEHQQIPNSSVQAYTDGSYHALVRV